MGIGIAGRRHFLARRRLNQASLIKKDPVSIFTGSFILIGTDKIAGWFVAEWLKNSLFSRLVYTDDIEEITLENVVTKLNSFERNDVYSLRVQ